MKGELYFLYLITNGKEIPYLPIEVRKRVIEYLTFKLSCLCCNEIILSFNPIIIAYSDGYSIINGNCICKYCKA